MAVRAIRAVGAVDALAVVGARNPCLKALAVLLQTLRLLAVAPFIMFSNAAAGLRACDMVRGRSAIASS